MGGDSVLGALSAIAPADLVWLVPACLFVSMTLAMKDGPAGLAAKWRTFWLERFGFERFELDGAPQAVDRGRPALVIEHGWFRRRKTKGEEGLLLLEDRWQDWRATFVSCAYCLAPWAFLGLLIIWTFAGAFGVLIVKVLAGAGLASMLFSVGSYG